LKAVREKVIYLILSIPILILVGTMKHLWKAGLPPIHCAGSSSSASIPADIDHLLAHPVVIPSYRSDIDRSAENVNPRLIGNSLIWEPLFRSGDQLEWRSDKDVQGYVKLVLQDVLALAGLEGKVTCVNELGIQGIRTDVWVIMKPVIGGVPIPIGVVEVKKPDRRNSNERALDQENVSGQIFDDLKRLQTFTGLREVFGILTSYDEWIICSLSASAFGLPVCYDLSPSNDLNVDALPKFPMKMLSTIDPSPEEASGSPDISLSRIIHRTEAIAFNDKTLIPLLVKVMLKMYYMPMDPVSLIGRECFIEISNESWAWRRRIFTELNYMQFPTRKAKSFLLLHDFRGGADGRVWLACSSAGRVCVIKFYYGEKDLRTKIALECKIWHDVWKLPARKLTLYNKQILMMPFVVSLSKQEVIQSVDYLEAVKVAVKAMAEQHYCHDDLLWKHVGFYRKPPTKTVQVEKLFAVFFDLSRVNHLPGRDTAMIENSMLSRLELAEPLPESLEFV
jgi:hypothetical protein